MVTPFVDRPSLHSEWVDGVKGKLHRIEEDLDLWLPNVVTIMLAQINARLRAQVAFEAYCRTRDGATEPVT